MFMIGQKKLHVHDIMQMNASTSQFHSHERSTPLRAYSLSVVVIQLFFLLTVNLTVMPFIKSI
jgi:hypothetical protein